MTKDVMHNQIQKMIYLVRGQRVMLDSDLAQLYHVVAMLSSVINSEQAIQINISIMRIFTKLRGFLLLEQGLAKKLDHLEIKTHKIFRIILERLDAPEQSTPRLPIKRRKISLKSN